MVCHGSQRMRRLRRAMGHHPDSRTLVQLQFYRHMGILPPSDVRACRSTILPDPVRVHGRLSRRFESGCC